MCRCGPVGHTPHRARQYDGSYISLFDNGETRAVLVFYYHWDTRGQACQFVSRDDSHGNVEIQTH